MRIVSPIASPDTAIMLNGRGRRSVCVLISAKFGLPGAAAMASSLPIESPSVTWSFLNRFSSPVCVSKLPSTVVQDISEVQSIMIPGWNQRASR
eukprot:6227257-Amphidinium_carterae.1